MNWKWRTGRLFLSMTMALFFYFGAVSLVHGEDAAVVFAAGSTINAVSGIGKLFEKQKLGDFTPSFAASSTLAKQIENGAPAGVFISANEKWMDYLEEEKMIDPATRSDLLSNRIVLIAPIDSVLDQVDIYPEFSLETLLNGGYLAMGDPDHVPAGIYGKQALESLGVWETVRSKVARQKDVRAALALVERGETSLGVVYATDAAITDKVKIVGVFPEDSHPKIIYPVALVLGNETAGDRKFIDFLKSPEARNVFEKYGFTTLY